MKTKSIISLNSAIEEAMNLGFRNRYILHDHRLYSLLTNTDFPESAFAIVESYPVRLNNGQKTYIYYIVLNNGQLGFMVDEVKKPQRHKLHADRIKQKIVEDTSGPGHYLENSFRE